jgi:hypothetical protein
MNPYFMGAETPWTELGEGIRRKIVGHTPELMSVLVQFEAEVAGVKRVLRAGDAFVAPRLHRHGVVALEPGSTLLDQFSPRRDDYL